MQQQASRVLLEQAREKFNSAEYAGAKETLQQLNETDRSIQLNRLITELEMSSAPEANEAILKKMLDMLTAINIELYEKNRPNSIDFISHEMLYCNIVMLASQIGKNTLAELISAEGLHFYKGMQSKTALSLLYLNLKRALSQNQLSTSFQLVEKFQRVNERARNLDNHEHRLKIMINALFIRSLLKLGLVGEAQALFMLKFEEADGEKFPLEERNSRFRRKTPVKYDDVIRFLQAEIEFSNSNYEKAIQLLSVYLMVESNRERVYAENNLGITLCMTGKAATGQKILASNSETLFKIASSPKKVNPEVLDLFQRSRENMMLAHLQSRENSHPNTHFNMDGDMKCYNQMKNMDDLMSFKLEYRKAQVSLNLYHSLLEKSQRKLPWEDIHDNYDTVFYLPNQPYYQFKGRNKNTYLANKKPVYRRYVLNEWNDNPAEEQVDKDVNRRKFEKQAHSLKLKELLQNTEQCLKRALLLLGREECKPVRLESPEEDMVKPINEKLYHEYRRFKSSILTLLAYTSLCQCKWSHVLNYACQFEDKKLYDTSGDDAYSIEMYKVEALCQLDRIDEAYESIPKLVQHNKMNKDPIMAARDGSNMYNCNMEKGMSQEVNFLFNLAVVHSRDNGIPKTHHAIQNLFEHMKKSPTMPRMNVNLPLSMGELLIHYNLRIQNNAAALEIIRHRRILSMGSKTILNITK